MSTYYNDGFNCQTTLNNKTTIITNLYEGIPQTLILNAVAWIFLILLFTLLRQQAWDYGRLALVNSATGKKWTQIFYAHGNNQEILNSLSNEMIPPASPEIESHHVQMHRQQSVADSGFFSWIKATWKLRRDQILRHSGPDACHYLSFQQHLIIVMGCITFVSIVIILPINFGMGTLSGDINSFAHTTIANLDPNSNWMWVHTTFAILFVPLVVLVMRRASGRNAFKITPTRTVMMTEVEKPDCNRNTIQNYLQQIFPDVEVRDVQLAYNIKKLSEAAREYEKVIEARIYCEQHRGIRVKPSCITCDTIDALEFYKSEEQRLCGEVARMKSAALNDPLGIAFVTVSSTSVAKQMIAHFKPSTQVKDWNLSYAPAPGDIFWENLTNDSAKWYFRWIVVNSIMFMFLFFLTTPAYVVQLMVSMARAQSNSTDPNVDPAQSSPLITEFLPTLLLWSLTALMPIVVAYSESFLHHWTRSAENYAIMTKTFGYLLFMILVLPSLGFLTASAFIEWSVGVLNKTDTIRFECIFLPDRGAFFVNYIITMCFIGTALELIRFPDLIIYIYKLLRSRSEAETPHIRKSIVIEFIFGIHYSWTVMVFTMATVYSLACPLITPFALLYLILKNFNDKHNLYFAYGPSHMISQGGGKIHSTAVTMTKVSVVLLLIAFTGISYLRGGNMFNMRSSILMISLVSSLLLFGCMSPIKKCTTKPLTIIEDDSQIVPVYTADVFLNNRINGHSPSHISYGSSDNTSVEFNTEHSSPEAVNINVRV